MIRAPAFSAARASPPTTFPGLTAPPGTMRTTLRSPESLQRIGETWAGSERPNSYTPGSSRPESMRKVCRIFLYPASTSPSPGSGPAAVSASASPPVRPLAPSPSEDDSNTRTDFFGASLRSHAAVASPVKPAPTMAKSTCSGKGRTEGRKSTVQGGAPQGCVLRDMAFVLLLFDAAGVSWTHGARNSAVQIFLIFLYFVAPSFSRRSLAESRAPGERLESQER